MRSFNFHIKKSQDTSQYFKKSVGQKLENFLLLVCKSTYWLWLLVLGFLPKMQIFIFTSQNSSRTLWESSCSHLSKSGQRKYLWYPSNTLKYVFLFTLSFCSQYFWTVTIGRVVVHVYNHTHSNWPHLSANKKNYHTPMVCEYNTVCYHRQYQFLPRKSNANQTLINPKLDK